VPTNLFIKKTSKKSREDQRKNGVWDVERNIMEMKTDVFTRRKDPL
jgi:hypothetical protein